MKFYQLAKKPRLEKKSDDINNEKTIVSLLANRMWNIFIRNQYSVITELFTGMLSFYPRI